MTGAAEGIAIVAGSALLYLLLALLTKWLLDHDESKPSAAPRHRKPRP